VSEEREVMAGDPAELRVVGDAQIVLAMFLARRDDPDGGHPSSNSSGC
jgi:hypothetical protein